MLTGPFTSGLIAVDSLLDGPGLNKLIARLGTKQGEYITSGSDKATNEIDAAMNDMSFEITHQMRKLLASKSANPMSSDGYTVLFGARIPL